MKPNSVVDVRVRKTLVDSLYSNTMSLIIGAVAATGVCLAAALTVGSPLLIAAACCVGVTAFLRTALVFAFRLLPRSSTQTLELLFEIGAFAFAAALSATASIAVWQHVSFEAQMLLVVVAVSYATAIAARNAGTPFIAFGQVPEDFPESPWDIAACPELNEYQGNCHPQVQLQEVRSA